MRLHLDTSTTGAVGSPETTNASSSLAGAGKSTGLNAPDAGTSAASGANLRDSVAVSSASSAWSASFSDRAGRVGQLSAAVQGGTYRVASAAISQSIVASAASARA
jgi:hypothetical protein